MTPDVQAELDSLRTRITLLSDIEAIRKLKHTYCRFNDGGWPAQGPSHMGPTADLFTEDGIWDGRPAAPLSVGREAIRAMMVSYRGHSPFVIHDVMNPDIEVTGDTATGHWSALVFSAREDGARMILGEYYDTYERTAEGWRIKSLKFNHIRAIPIQTTVVNSFVKGD